MKKLLTLFIALAAFAMTGNGQMLVYDNGVVAGTWTNGLASDSDFLLYRADDFTLGSNATINLVEWTGRGLKCSYPFALHLFENHSLKESGSLTISLLVWYGTEFSL